MYKGELVDVETVLDDISLLCSDTINYCGVTETSKTLYQKCLIDKNCDINTITTNAKEHMIKMIEVMMSLADLTSPDKTWSSINKPADLGDIMYNIGADLGDLVVSLFGL
jgi:hypothetical protein